MLTWEPRSGLWERPAGPAIWALHARATLISWPSVASGGTPLRARTALRSAKNWASSTLESALAGGAAAKARPTPSTAATAPATSRRLVGPIPDLSGVGLVRFN